MDKNNWGKPEPGRYGPDDTAFLYGLAGRKGITDAKEKTLFVIHKMGYGS